MKSINILAMNISLALRTYFEMVWHAHIKRKIARDVDAYTRLSNGAAFTVRTRAINLHHLRQMT